MHVAESLKLLPKEGTKCLKQNHGFMKVGSVNYH